MTSGKILPQCTYLEKTFHQQLNELLRFRKLDKNVVLVNKLHSESNNNIANCHSSKTKNAKKKNDGDNL